MKKRVRLGANYLPGLLASFIMLVLLILAIWLASFWYISRSTREDAVKNSQRLLLQGEQALDNQLISLRQFTMSLLVRETIESFNNVCTPLSNADYDLLRRCSADFPNLSSFSSSIANAAIYFHASDVILSPQITTARASLAYEHFFQYEGMDYSQWLLNLRDHLYAPCLLSAQRVCMPGQTGSYLTYLHTVFSSNYRQHAATAFVLVPESTVFDCFNTLKVFGMSGLTLYDSDGNTLCSTQDVQMRPPCSGPDYEQSSLNGEDVLVLRSTSHVSGFTCVVTIPMHTVLARVYGLNTMFCVLFLAALSIGISLSVLLSHLSSLPVRRMQEKLRSYAGEEDAASMTLKSFNLSINSIILKNSDLTTQLSQQHQLLVTSFKEHLFQTGFNSQADLRDFMKTADLFIDRPHYAVVVLALDDYRLDVCAPTDELLRLQHLAVADTFNALAEVAAFYTLDISRVAVLVGWLTQEPLSQVLHNFAQKLRIMNISGLPIPHSLGVSAEISTLMDVPAACRQAERALESAGLEIYQVLFYSELPLGSCVPEYDATLESQFTRYIRAGDEEASLALLDTLFINNLLKPCVPAALQTQFLFDIRSTLLHVLNALSAIDDAAKNELLGYILALNPSEPCEQCEPIVSIVKRLCACVNESQQQSRSRFNESIIEYIKDQYQNDMLSLSSVAEHFQLSQAYLSRLIKAQMKMTFSEYLEGLRMQLAKDCLLNTDMSIKDIVTKCGYINPNTFFKAFKRTFGVSPSEYRQDNIVNKT